MESSGRKETDRSLEFQRRKGTWVLAFSIKTKAKVSWELAMFEAPLGRLHFSLRGT